MEEGIVIGSTIEIRSCQAPRPLDQGPGSRGIALTNRESEGQFDLRTRKRNNAQRMP